jgi:hypothetical protein
MSVLDAMAVTERDEVVRFLAEVAPRITAARVQYVAEFPVDRVAFYWLIAPDRLLAGRHAFETLVETGFEVVGAPPPPYAWGRP